MKKFIHILYGQCALKCNQIGIVTPYKNQCRQIIDMCRRERWHDILIGSAEKFQGNERDSIIISTVRSGRDELGEFVTNPKVSFSTYLNCLLSRAKQFQSHFREST